MRHDLSSSPALWNRRSADLASDEVLAQILDRGTLADWREIYRLASGASEGAMALRRRIVHLCRTVPLAFPHLFLAAAGSLGEELEPYPEVPAPMDDVA